MKCHIGVDIESGLVYTVRGTSGAANDVVEANRLVRDINREVWTDAGHRGTGKRPDARCDVTWYIAMRPGKRRQLDPPKPVEALTAQLGRVKARYSGPSRTRVPSAQAPVRSRQNALPQVGQEGGATAHAVRVSQSLDGAARTAESYGMSAPAVRQIGLVAAKATPQKTFAGGKSQACWIPLRSLQLTGACERALCGPSLALQPRGPVLRDPLLQPSRKQLAP